MSVTQESPTRMLFALHELRRRPSLQNVVVQKSVGKMLRMVAQWLTAYLTWASLSSLCSTPSSTPRFSSSSNRICEWQGY